MRLLYSSPDSAEVGLLKSVLDEAGIPCEVRNNCISQAIPGVPFYPELWIMNDENYCEASELLAAGRCCASSNEPETI
jgi:hypothetical protein